MRKIFTITLIIFSVFINSCKKENKEEQKENSEVEFVIQGTAKNGNGKKLGLYIPSLGMDKRLTSEIVDGKFEFKGTLPNPERAEVAFDEELEEFDGMYASYIVFLTNDTLKINATVNEKDGNFYFSDNSFEDGGVNSYYHQNIDEFWKAYDGLSFNPSDKVLMDSLKEYAFPTIRKNVIRVNEKLFNDKTNTIIGLNNLRNMFDNNFVFILEDMADEEKESITNYFNNIDTSYTSSPDYTVVSSHIKRMNDAKFGKKFMDFALPNIEGEEIRLSDVVSANEYTVLDFWWSGCGPCRTFNRESKAHYKKLKEHGIEIIAINVDDGMKKWQRATEKDEIDWINLYAGANSKIEADYNIVFFPTKMIFDKNKKRVNFDFHKATELLTLID
ncbi:protein of unknown function [Salegentibacter echinorum]|uniref:Thioredoxin domain-containing protein n=1 Tax=Salegentibacter echinorum TaxID=1073325 RepID=A0A1M5L3K6_SALEC|nr:TlpA disulfide reductase family protein [Salegentibacter echinorum]SHG59597.1 protein of unknown function [Salegentibacter echinorum]